LATSTTYITKVERFSVVMLSCCFSVSGFIGKIQLQVPLRRLKSEHWVITLDKLVLVAGPLTDTEVFLYSCLALAEVFLKEG